MEYKYGHLTYFDDRYAEMVAAACQAAQSPITEHILLSGPPGSGKSELAKALHKGSPSTCNGQIVQVRWDGIGLDISAMWGRGGSSQGSVDFAAEGTIFLDDIQSFPAEILELLCNSIKTNSFFRNGGSESSDLGCRFILMTSRTDEIGTESPNGQAWKMLTELIPHKIRVPDLVEAKNQVVPIARLLLKNRNFGFELSADAEQTLREWPWTGGIRELNQTLERTAWEKNRSGGSQIITSEDIRYASVFAKLRAGMA
ncbi:MAG: sigma 54-interacting transcriptional regulator [Blastocatellia bacterium]|nr:sigma 54-interacting transcriptional regulator [Blastocatellia bacterium]